MDGPFSLLLGQLFQRLCHLLCETPFVLFRLLRMGPPATPPNPRPVSQGVLNCTGSLVLFRYDEADRSGNMLFKREFVSHSFREEGPHRTVQGCTGCTSDAQDAEEMSESVAQSLYCVFPSGKARQGGVNSLELVSINNFRRLRAIGVAPSGLVLAPG